MEEYLKNYNTLMQKLERIRNSRFDPEKAIELIRGKKSKTIDPRRVIRISYINRLKILITD